MTTKQLPHQPSLDQLRRQAKDLIRAFRSGDVNAKDRLAAQLKQAALALDSGRGASLSFAQLTIAREYGFESWPKLKFFIESQAMTFEQKLKAFTMAATENRLYYAKDLLKNEPRLAAHDLSTACLVGDLALVERLLKMSPSLTTKVGVRQWEPLLYVCFSYFHRDSAQTADSLVRIARLLIEKGANVNASYAHDGFEIPALYGPCGATNFPALAEVLLEAGANADERESLYHSTEFRDRKCLELLLKHGANPKKWGALHHILDVEDPIGAEQLLKAGADPNQPYEELGTALHHAVVRGRSAVVIDLLLSSGADPNLENPQGYTPYEMACRYGHAEAKRALHEKTTLREMSLANQFLSACAEGDRAKAEPLYKSGRVTLDVKDRRMIAELAALNKIAAVELMLDFGFDINERADWSGPVIQQAAWNGHVELVDRLLARGGVDLELANKYGGTALGATIFATSHCKESDLDERLIAIAESLLEAGARLNPAMVTWGSENMNEFLKTYTSEV